MSTAPSLTKEQECKIIEIPNNIRFGMSMNDAELTQLRLLSLKLLNDL